MRALDPTIIRHQIDNLSIAYPDLATDEEDWSLALASETDLDDLLVMLVRRIDDTKALLEGTDGRLKELQSRKERFGRRIEAYRTLILKLMSAADVKTRELAEATLSVCNVAPKVVGEPDPLTLPDDLVVVQRKPDRTAIKEALQAGREVTGCQLSNGDVSLTVRVK